MPEIKVLKKDIPDGFLRLLFMGFIIGIASIIPGLSGGALAISLGLYAPALDAVLNLRSSFKKSVSFLIPVGIGVLIGIILFGVVMKPLIRNFETSIIFLFMGFVLGSIPSYIKESNQNGFRILFLVPMLIAFSLGMILSGTVMNTITNSEVTPFILLLGGAVLALGIVVPGISSSFILMQMGIYEKILTGITEFDIFLIFWVGLGALITAILLVKIVNMAFKKFAGYAHYAAFGFLASSIVSVFPGFRDGIYAVIDIILFLLGTVFVYFFLKKEN